MLGTFLAWMGGIVTAAGSEATLGRRALPALAATIVVALIVRLAGVTLALPVATGGAFTLLLAALAFAALARNGYGAARGAFPRWLAYLLVVLGWLLAPGLGLPA